MALAGLVVAPTAARAADTDVVNVPDATLKAAINAAVGSGRTATQDVTVADAAKVTILSVTQPVTDLTGLEALTNLTTFGDLVAGNSYTDLAPVSGLTKLTALNVTNGSVTNLAPLAGMTWLKTLNLQGNQISDISPITGLTGLTSLTLSDNPVRDLSALPAATAMTTLRLVDTDIKNPAALVSRLGGAAATLATLDLSSNRISDPSSLVALGLNGSKLGSSSTASTGLLLKSNRIADLSVFSGWSKPPTSTKVTGQSVYVGPYATGGVVVTLKTANAAAVSVDPSVGAYDATTGALTVVDPTTPSVTVSPNWTVYFSNPPIDPTDDNGPQIAGSAVVGQALTVSDPGVTLTTAGCTTVSYEWLRDGEEFAGNPHFVDDANGYESTSYYLGGPGVDAAAANGRYVVSATDLGHQLSVRATCAATGVRSTSQPTATVTAEQAALPVVQALDGYTRYSSGAGIVTTTAEARSGVVGDSTNPTVPVYVAQLDAVGAPVNASQIQVALSSITPSGAADGSAVTAADVTITGTGTNRAIVVTPEKSTNGILTLTFTITGSTGVTSTFVLPYEASVATTPTSRVLLGEADASTAVDVGNGYMMVGDDEGFGRQSVRLYDSTTSSREVAAFNVGAGNAVGGEWDLEASARKGNTVWWFGSHGNDKDGKNQTSRQEIFASTLTGTGASATLAPSGVVYKSLKTDLVAWDHANGDRFGLTTGSAVGNKAETLNGIDIEGAEFSPDGSELYLGMRAPISPAQVGGNAVIIPVTNLEALTAGTATKATFGDPILVDLGGDSIREIRKNSAGEYLILSAPAGVAPKAAVQETLWAWNGEPETAPQRLTTPISKDVEPNYSDNAGAWEGIFAMPDHLVPGARVGLIMDQGYAQLYAPGKDNKDDAAFGYTAKSRTDLVTLAGPMGTVATLSTPAAFATQAAETIGTAQSVTLSNQGIQPIHVGRVFTSDQDGVSADDFLISGDSCSGITLQPATTCTVRVRFAPSRVNAVSTASLVVKSDVAAGSSSVTLTGTSTELPKGDKGDTGADGTDGTNGTDGAQGPKGDTGSTGAPGASGTTGATGAQGPKGDKGDPGAQGGVGLTGPQGPAGTIGFSAAKSRVTVHAGSTAKLRFLVQNRTAGAISATLKTKTPGALRSSVAKSLTLKQLGTGRHKTVAFGLKVGSGVKAGRYKVRVTFLVGGSKVTRTVVVKVVR